ncbi:hypothetical protein FSP39_007847 [Pinctada imbricata]|uniref:C2H2-type domain-containing protein n=1 Tax=Pinctada imbricata TaxID=66713 RepID=A0AA88YVV3_PINIB|nr:hypothetical protein FSP39_007847 [Pinctada imbricata]
MGVQCDKCGAEYANGRNLKRHYNAVHSDNVKYVQCGEKMEGGDACDRIFYRREYLPIHLEAIHHIPKTEAKDLAGKANFLYTDRGNVEVTGPNEKRVRTEPLFRKDENENVTVSEETQEKRTVQGPSLPGALDQEVNIKSTRGPSCPGASDEELVPEIVILEDASEFDEEVQW